MCRGEDNKKKPTGFKVDSSCNDPTEDKTYPRTSLGACDSQPVKPEEWMAVFHIYADASGKLSNSAYTSFCGYVAQVSEWARFTSEWENCRFKWQVPPLHMSAIMHPDEDAVWGKVKARWGTEWEAKRDAMLEDFAGTVRRADIVCVGAVVDAAHFRKLAFADPDFAKLFKDTMYLALHKLVTQGIEKTEVVDKHSPISLVLDDDPEYSMMCYGLLQAMKRDVPKVKERIHGIAFVDDESFPGVQAADVIAYESRRLMVDEMKDPNTQPSELFKSLTLGLTHQPLHFTPSVLDEMQADIHAATSQNQKGPKP